MSPSELDHRLRFGVEIARQAGDQTLEFFQQALTVERKSDDSPVTIADKSAEQLLRERIADRFPHDGIVGEEFGTTEGNSGYRWILDPIDGTKSFISGVPLYGTMVGLECDGKSVLGVVYLPGLQEGIFAAQGQGAWHFRGQNEPQAARVSQRKSLSTGVFVTSQVDTFEKRQAGDAFRQLQQAAYITRTWGDCYGYLLVATGRVEVMVDPMMSIWDAAALQPIMEEAGGTFTDWQGNATIHAGEGIGTNAHILAEVLEITRQFPPLPS
ncbi:MAG TPA: histidinol-phosphatase [Planctomycetaceae bacterium]|nr:histidinol-phosphatase [Planctomycetaceae bacterium]|tara:strand:+ start:952 stop:1758 length:807 start_codon:yes stop_codon:yes gene_type:complete